MTGTPNLALAYIASQQAQKEVTHNAALNDLDFLMRSSVIDHTLNTPPGAPNTGDAYIIGPAPTGAWSGYAGAVAGYYGGWSIKVPAAGWVAWTRNGNHLLVYQNGMWGLVATPQYDGVVSWTPGSIAVGAGVTSAAVAIGAAAVGDFASVAAPYDLQGMTATGYVNAAGSAVVRLVNLTGGAVSLGSGSWRVRVSKV